MNWFQIIAALVVVAGLGALGWVVKGKFDRAAEADRLEIELSQTNDRLKAQVEATRTAETARVAISVELAAERKKRESVTKEIVRYVRIQTPDDRRCDIPVDVLHKLNEARGYPAVPSPAQ
jgi:uncharacterized protein (DUF3084 family)